MQYCRIKTQETEWKRFSDSCLVREIDKALDFCTQPRVIILRLNDGEAFITTIVWFKYQLKEKKDDDRDND